MKILLATNNPGKINEFRDLLVAKNEILFVTVDDLAISDFIPVENGETFRENAHIKAKAFYKRTGYPSIADDSGLIVEQLVDQPGINSARYAGPGATDETNIDLLLKNMEGLDNRRASFHTVICFYDGVGVVYAEGTIDGSISTSPKGSRGFGYDPIFIPDGFSESFAQMDPKIKNKISHRAIALKEFKENYLDNLT